MKKTTLLVILLPLMLACSREKHNDYDLVIQNVGLFDGQEDQGIVNLAIRGDTIALISKEPVNGNSILDGTNKYVLPGLINSHVHITSPDDLKESLNAGIMAVIDLHQSSEENAAILRSFRDSLDYAYFASSGFAATLPGGHPTQFGEIETVSDNLTASEWVENRLYNGADLIKIIRDGGGGPPDFQEIPTLSFDQINNIISAAKEQNKLSVAHTVTLEETTTIAAFGIDGFAHLWFGKESVSDEQLQALVNSGVFIIPTTQTQARIWEMVETSPPPVKAYAEENMSSMESVQKEILRLHKAGIKILAGNDPPNFEINYGNDLYDELKIYRDAGISNLEVLKTATGYPSAIFDLKSYGSLKVGMPANMLLIDGNPIKNLNDLSRIEHIWKNGKRIK